MTQDDLYFWMRVVAWWVDFGTFCILAYKYVSNNWTGKQHNLNWGAVGMWAGTFAYAYGVGEILYDRETAAGSRVFISSLVVLLWCWIAIFKIPISKELDPKFFGTEDNNDDL